MTVPEVGRRLGVSEDSVRRLIAAGALQARRYRPGSHIRIDALDVERLIEASKIGGGGPPDGARGPDPVGQSSRAVPRRPYEEAVSP